MNMGYGYINTNQDFKLETYKDYLNSELIKNKSMSLVHYSLANRGSALYYQKMFIIRLFRQSFLKNKIVSEDFKLKNGYVEGIRHIGFGTSFQQKYCFLTILHQVRRKVTDVVYNNDSNKIGTFKNFINNNNYKTGNSLYAADVEGRRTYNFKRIVWNLKSSINVSLHYLFTSRMPTAKKTLEMKSGYFIPNKDDFFLFKNDIIYLKMKESVVRSLGSLTKFIRTLWYRLTVTIEQTKKPANNYDYSGYLKFRLIKTEALKMVFGSKIKNKIFSAIGIAPFAGVDFQKELRIGGRRNHRFFVKKHVSWRLGLGFWACKILRFSKTRLFWKFSRGLTGHYYRGFIANSVFRDRADMYAMRHFNILSLKFSRLLIMTKHIFIGSYAIRNPETRIMKFSMLTMSRRAFIYLSKRKYYRLYKNKKNTPQFKIIRNSFKSAPLRFCRQQKDLAFWGTIRNVRYYLNYGSDLNLLNIDSKKTRFFSLNYFYVQKAVATSWW